MRNNVEATIASAEAVRRTLDDINMMQDVTHASQGYYYEPDWASYPDARFDQNVAFNPSAVSS